MGLLVIGRRSAAEAVFDRVLARWPDDAYALASRAHLRAAAGRPASRASPTRSAWSPRIPRAAPPTGSTSASCATSRRARSGRGGLPPRPGARPQARPRLVRPRPRPDPPAPFDEAVAALKRNTELQPMSPYGWYQLARVHMDRRQPEEARRIIAPPEGLRAEGGGATGAGNRRGRRRARRTSLARRRTRG